MSQWFTENYDFFVFGTCCITGIHEQVLRVLYKGSCVDVGINNSVTRDHGLFWFGLARKQLGEQTAHWCNNTMNNRVMGMGISMREDSLLLDLTSTRTPLHQGNIHNKTNIYLLLLF